MPAKKKSNKIKLTINNIKVEADSNETIMEVSKRLGFHIPHLCKHERLHDIGSCRLCVVEVEGRRNLTASCCSKVIDGIKVKTHSPKVLESRRINIELLLANHDLNCTTCVKNLNCKLQRYASELMVNEIRFEGKKRNEAIDNSSVSIRRDNNKCILCGRCTRTCNDVQSVYAIGKENRGFNTHITPAFERNMKDSSCVNCGQCVIVCPTGALSEKSDIQPVIDALNSDKFLIVQTAPSIRAALGECFNMPPGTPVTGKMVTSLREAGFHKVFDTDLAADITIIEEATEFIKRLKKKDSLPMITTCCPAWIKFAEQYFYDQLNHMSSCRSPQAIMGSLVKTYFAKKMKINPKDIVLVNIMPCTAKKFEIQRPEFNKESDYVLTTVELAKLLKQLNIDFANLPEGDFDNPLGESSGAGVIFGKSGGVMEAALRTASDWIHGKNLKNFEYKKIRGMDTLKETELKIGKDTIKIACVHTLGEARKIMEDIKSGSSPYHFIEIMACYGGCIGGGGQPKTTKKILSLRASALRKEDVSKKIRKSHKNPSALKIYDEFLGKFGSKKAHKLLHTKYKKRNVL